MRPIPADWVVGGSEVQLGRRRGHGGGRVSLALSHSSPSLSGCSDRRCSEIPAWGAGFRWLQWGISRPLSVSLTLLPLSPVALTSDAQRFRHGGGISVVAVGSTIVVLWVFSTRERTWEVEKVSEKGRTGEAER
jgi:hypothetical protein